jgi:putative tryptophan/tyrosine transport system substrate-binding protein
MRGGHWLFSVIFTVAAVSSSSALAQSAEKVWRLGVLTPALTGAPFDSLRTVMLPELAKDGFVEGHNLVLEIRGGNVEKLPELAKELAATRPDAVVAVTSSAVRAIRQALPTTPIVGSFIGDDPIDSGFAVSFARPGGTVTGIVMLAPELDGKRVHVLHEAVPSARRIAVLTRSAGLESSSLAEMRKAVAQIGLNLVPFAAATPQEFSGVFLAMRAANVEALAIASVAEFAANASSLADFALQANLPTVCEWDWMARDGCLLGYGPDFDELRRRTADYVVKIFRGAAPGDLPLEQPIRFKFTINLKTAHALGITMPSTLLARADEVIE